VNANPPTADIARRTRLVLRWLLTVGSAVLFTVLTLKIALDVWVGNDATTVDALLAGVTISLSVTFGSAFVGWFGVRPTTAQVGLAAADTAKQKRRKIYGAFISTTAGAAIIAMILYLGAGAFAGVTYLFNADETPTVLITVATAWAAQASAIVGATLATALTPE
jgi:hypothetical protein